MFIPLSMGCDAVGLTLPDRIKQILPFYRGVTIIRTKIEGGGRKADGLSVFGSRWQFQAISEPVVAISTGSGH
jgi:hypothetical protein